MPDPTPRPQFTTVRSAVAIRQATGDDRQALADMVARCSGLTRQRRFLAPLRSFPEPYLTEALAGRAEHFALIAATPSAVVALASCRAVGNETAELAVIVEDASQLQGIGTCLLRELISHADSSGLHTLRASVLAEQAWIVRVLGSYGTCTTSVSTGVIDVTVRRETRVPTWTANQPELLAHVPLADRELRAK
jgi:N-acetylglutamate synthase-like GNAT family acetyltransferase